MNCSQCNSPLNPNSKFCGVCGNPVWVTPPPTVFAAPAPPFSFSPAAPTAMPMPIVPQINMGAIPPVAVLQPNMQIGGPFGNYVQPLSIEQLRSPREKAAFIVMLIGALPAIMIFLFVVFAPALLSMSFGARGGGVFLSLLSTLPLIGILLLMVLVSELAMSAHIKTNGVRVSSTQLTEIFQTGQHCAQRLGMNMPEIYIMHGGIWNAFAACLGSRRKIVLYGTLVDSILMTGDLTQLTFVLGHEFGHHAAGHASLGRYLLELFVFASFFFFPPVVLCWLWYHRHCEVSADRIGLYCAGSLQSSQTALANYMVGSQLANKVSFVEAGQQWFNARHEFFVWLRKIYSSYPEPLRRLYELSVASGLFGIR